MNDNAQPQGTTTTVDLREQVASALAIHEGYNPNDWRPNQWAALRDEYLGAADAVLAALGLDDFEKAVERLEDSYISHPGDPFDAREDFRVALKAALTAAGQKDSVNPSSATQEGEDG